MSALGRTSTAARKFQVRLKDVDPDFLRFVAEEERGQAGEVMLPAINLEEGAFDPQALLSEAGESCGVLISGMVNRQIQLADQVALRILGPGAIIPVLEVPSSAVIASSEWIAVGGVQLALVGTQFMRAAARWPQLQRNLIARFADQNEQLAAQLALCQLPRVEDRLLAMLWLLAESWGKVTSAGTLLPLHFTHEALGAMVGARRPTVTLALGELANSGAVVQREGGWLLLEPAPQAGDEHARVESPLLLELTPTAWAQEDRSIDRARLERQELFNVVSRLREQHRRSVSELHERLRRAEAIRARSNEIRDQLRKGRRSGRGPEWG